MITKSYSIMKKYILFFTLLIIVLKILGQKKIFKSKISNEINFNSFKHLFILSGQSNMVGLDPDESFIPILEKKFGKEKIIIIKDAKSGQPIRRWNKTWKGKNFEIKDSIGNLYNSLINKVRKVLINKKINTVTFIWMQGERDAREELADFYEESLIDLYNQLTYDLKFKDINFLIGRISDFDLLNINYKHWTRIRDIQVKVAESNIRFDWIDTDDLNDGINKKGIKINNDLHYSVSGYKILGQRFAEKAIKMIDSLN